MEEKTEVIQESTYRIGMKQLANEQFRCEFTVRSNDFEELKKKFEEVKKYIKKQLTELNGG